MSHFTLPIQAEMNMTTKMLAHYETVVWAQANLLATNAVITAIIHQQLTTFIHDISVFSSSQLCQFIRASN